MPIYDYECQECLETFEIFHNFGDQRIFRCIKCKSKNVIKMISIPSITGTRDNFGINKSFKDENNGKVIDNWKSWERAGYRNPVEVTKSNTIKEKIKSNIEKRQHKKISI